MPRPVHRLFVTLLALAAWFVAGTAFAAAPICDDRGASAFAPPPTLDPPNESIDVGTGPDACVYAVDDGISLHEGRTHDPLPTPAGEALLLARAELTVLAATESGSVMDRALAKETQGVSGRVDRPPR